MRGPFAIVVGAAMVLLIVGVIFSLAPTLGGSIEDAKPDLAVESSWNSTHNTALVEGGTFFSDNATWVGLLFLGLVAGIVIAMFARW